MSTPELHLTNVETGRDRVIHPPEGLRNYDGRRAVFSPDGRILAVPVTRGGESFGSRRLAIIDVRTHRVRVVPASRVSHRSAHGSAFVAWASDGRSVFMGSPGYGPNSPPEIIVYRLGDRRAHRIPVTVRGFLGMAAS
jgi:hypothetical protein